MPTIYLIRHGQASFGADDYDNLSELGMQQATHVGNYLAQRLPHFDAVALGDLRRHRQTAENCMCAMGQGLKEESMHVNPGWNEYDHQRVLANFDPQLGTAEGTLAFIRGHDNPGAAYEKVFSQAMQKWMESDSGEGYAESWLEFTERVHTALHSLIEDEAEAKNIGVFTSGGPIALLSQALLGVPQENIMHLNWTLVNCGITKLVKTRSRLFVASLNEHAHFEGDHQAMLTYK